MSNIKSSKFNALLNAFKQCCAIIFPLITFPYVTRVLGSVQYGIYNFSVSIVSYFILIAALGVNTYAIREGARIRDKKTELNSFCSEVFSINVCSMLVAYLLLFILLLCNVKVSSYRIYILILSLAMLLTTIGADWVNSIFEDYLYITIRYIVVQCVALVLLFVFVKEPKDLIPYCIIYVLASYGGNLFNIVYITKYVRLRFTTKLNIKKHIVPLLVLFVNTIAVTVYVNSDITMLGFIHGDEIVGIYSFASKIYSILKQLIFAIVVVFVPRISYILNNKPDLYKAYINKIFSALSLVLLPIVAGTFCLADLFISITGGQEYLSGASSLRILSFALIFAIYASLFSHCILIVNKQEKQCLKSTVVSAIVNIGLNFLLLPTIGMVGAAITTLIAEGVNCILQVRFAKKCFDVKEINLSSAIGPICGSILIVGICMLCRICLKTELQIVGISVSVSVLAYCVIQVICKNQLVYEMLQSIKRKLKK